MTSYTLKSTRWHSWVQQTMDIYSFAGRDEKTREIFFFFFFYRRVFFLFFENVGHLSLNGRIVTDRCISRDGYFQKPIFFVFVFLLAELRLYLE